MKKIIYSLGLLISIGFANAYAQGLQHNYSQSIGTASSSQTINKTINDAAGNSYIVGSFSGTVDFDPSAGTATLTANLGSGAFGNDAFIAKYNSTGGYMWAFKIGTGTNFEDVARDISIDDANGMIYVTGNFSGFNVDFDPSSLVATVSGGSQAVFLAKYTTAGVYQNAIQILGNVNGFGVKYFNNTIYITGENTGTTNFNPTATTNVTSNGSSPDIYVASYNSLLNLFWAFNVGNTLADGGASVDVDAGGNCYITGKFTGVVDFDPSGLTANLTSSGGSDGFIVKYNPSGNYQWAQRFGTSAGDGGKKIKVTTGAAYIVGYFGGTNLAYLTKHDITNFGVQLLQKTLPGTADVFASDVNLDAVGNVYITGHFNGANQSFDGTGTITFSNRGGYDAYIAKYTPTFAYLYAFTFGGPNNDYSASISVDASNNVNIAGIYAGTANFSAASTVTNNLTSASSYDIFMAKYAPCTLPSAPVTADAIICFPANLTFTASGSGTITWHYTSTDGAFASGNTYTTVNTNPNNTVSTTTVYAQNNDACGASPKSAIVYTINPNPVIQGITSPTLICSGQVGNIYPLGLTATNFTLVNTGATVLPNGVFTVTPNSTTVYTITGQNSYGCTTNTTITQNVSACTGINEITINSLFSIYPNPANEFINVELVAEALEATTISIISALGEVVLNEKVSTNNITLKTENLTNGIYFIKIESRNGSAIKKFIKQ